MPTSTISHIAQDAFAIYFSHLGILKFISVIISAGLVAAIIAIMINTGWLSSRIDRAQDIILKANQPKKKIQHSWKNVQSHFFAGDDNDLKIAIVEADQLLGEALLHAGVRGVNLGERLKNVKKDQVPNLDDIWAAHKLRNQIAHEAGFQLKRDVAERALGVYEKALQSLGALE